jgi:heptaprenyl diphosphate synthase
MKRYAIPDIARKYVEYDMIQKHTELPDMAEPRLRMLYAFLSEQNRLAQYGELYALVVSLVQIGLDTHDLIDTSEEKRSEPEMRARQLKVLAGDYFSARFYQLLAQAGQVGMIAKISHAVCEVNRQKVSLYMRMRQLRLLADDYLTAMIDLRGELFLLFAKVMDAEPALLWPEVVAGVSRLETLAAEIKHSADPAAFEQSWAFWHVLQEGSDEDRKRLAAGALQPDYIAGLHRKYKIEQLLAAKLAQAAEAVKTLADKLSSEALLAELNAVVDSLLNVTPDLAPAINEMR